MWIRAEAYLWLSKWGYIKIVDKVWKKPQWIGNSDGFRDMIAAAAEL